MGHYKFSEVYGLIHATKTPGQNGGRAENASVGWLQSQCMFEMSRCFRKVAVIEDCGPAEARMCRRILGIERHELIESKQGTTDATAALEAWLDQADQGTQVMPSTQEAQRAGSAEAAQSTPALADPAVNLSKLALLSSAAWRTAQSTEASRRMDYAWMLQISQTYELQAMYQAAQSATIDALVTHRTSMDEATRRATARALLGRIRVLTSLGQALEDDYADIL